MPSPTCSSATITDLCCSPGLQSPSKAEAQQTSESAEPSTQLAVAAQLTSAQLDSCSLHVHVYLLCLSSAKREDNFRRMKVHLSIEKNKILECQNECMKNQIKDLRSSLDLKESKSCGLAQEARDAQHKCENLKVSLDNERSLYIEAVRERDDYKTHVERLESELEKQMQALQQLLLKFENETTFLQHEIAETKATTNKLLTDLGMSKESARALQETADQQAKQLEDEKSKVCTLQKIKEELSQSNAVIIAENKQLLLARDSDKLHFDFLKSELQATRALNEQTAAEVIRLQKNVEQSKEHIASLHESVKKSEEAIKTKNQELAQQRVLINEVEKFEEAQMTKLQQHLEKLKCARQACPL